MYSKKYIVSKTLDCGNGYRHKEFDDYELALNQWNHQSGGTLSIIIKDGGDF